MYSTLALFAPLGSHIRRLATVDARTPLVARIGMEDAWSTTVVSCIVRTDWQIAALAFSPDGRCIACSDENATIRVLNAQTGAELQVCKTDHNLWDLGISFSPTGKELLSGTQDGGVYVWDVTTGVKLEIGTTTTSRNHSTRDSLSTQDRIMLRWMVPSTVVAVYHAAWSPDGKLVTSCQRQTINLWRVASPTQSVQLQRGNSEYPHFIMFSQDGFLLAGLDAGTCEIWDVRSVDWDTEAGVTLTQTLKNDSRVLTLAVSSDSRFVACGLSSGEIVLWTKSDGKRVQSLPGRSPVTSLVFYPNGLLAAAYGMSPFVLWDVSTGTPVKTESNEESTVVAFAPDGRHIAHATYNHLQIEQWSSEIKQNTGMTTSVADSDKQLTHRSERDDEELLEKHGGKVAMIATSPTGKLVLAVYEDEVRIYEVSSGRCMCAIKHPHMGKHGGVAVWSPAETFFARTGADKVVCVWKADTGELVGTLEGHSRDIKDVRFTRDEQHVLSASRDGTIRRGTIGQNGQLSPSEVLFQSNGDCFSALAVSSDGQWILSASHRSGSTPDTSSADLLAPPSRQPVRDAYGGYHVLRLHDATGRVVWIEYHPCDIRSVAFSEDCTRALAGSWEGEVFLYDLTQLIPPHDAPPRLLTVPEHRLSAQKTPYPIKRISFSPDGQAVISDRNYTSIPPELQLEPLRSGPADPSFTSVHYYQDEWIWQVNLDSTPRRLYWIPPSHRLADTPRERMFSQSANGRSIAYKTSQGFLVVMQVTSASQW
ncbi:hypothetical protein ONZ51_g9339 [Trametes cubensis]|uniref:WD40 repeat-like protein n=1 Tax=Trametes cubensis TaxID=1111947 RepID=A0AAD7X7S3_9APHY|nr:hypothetical protein ONZ51_g9339 [Trametes cubensis]